MRRLTAILVAPLFLILLCVLILVILGLVVNEMKSGRPAVIHFKADAPVKEKDQVGEVTKGGKYVTIKRPDGTADIYTWDQIFSITGSELPSTRKLDRV